MRGKHNRHLRALGAAQRESPERAREAVLRSIERDVRCLWGWVVGGSLIAVGGTTVAVAAWRSGAPLWAALAGALTLLNVAALRTHVAAGRRRRDDLRRLRRLHQEKLGASP